MALLSSSIIVLALCIVCAVHASCGFLHISGEEVEESKFDIRMQMYAKKLDKKDFFGKVCPYVCACVCIHMNPYVSIAYNVHCLNNNGSFLLVLSNRVIFRNPP